MDLPSAELASPLPPHARVAAAAPDATVLALDGRATDVGFLPDLARLRFLWVSRVSPSTAAVIGTLTRLERLVIHDYRAVDLRPLAKLANLASLAIAGSPNLRSLDGLESLTALAELILFANCNYDDLGPLGALQRLETLCLEGGFSKPLRVRSLAPLAQLGRLERLRLASLRVADRSLTPLRGLGRLREVFIADTFPKGEMRALAAALPRAKGRWLDQYRSAV